MTGAETVIPWERTVFLPEGSPAISSINDVLVELRLSECGCARGGMFCLGEADILIDYRSAPPARAGGLFGSGESSDGSNWQALITLPLELCAEGPPPIKPYLSIRALNWYMVSSRGVELEAELVIGEAARTEAIPEQEMGQPKRPQDHAESEEWVMIALDDMNDTLAAADDEFERIVRDLTENAGKIASESREVWDKYPDLPGGETEQPLTGGATSGPQYTEEEIRQGLGHGIISRDAASIEYAAEQAEIAEELAAASGESAADMEDIPEASVYSGEEAVVEEASDEEVSGEIAAGEMTDGEIIEEINEDIDGLIAAPLPGPVRLVFGENKPTVPEPRPLPIMDEIMAAAPPVTAPDIAEAAPETAAATTESSPAIPPEQAQGRKGKRRLAGLPCLNVDAKDNNIEISAFNFNIKL